MIKKSISIVMLVLVSLLCANSVNAKLIKTVIDTESYHHLGDQTYDWMQEPIPEGITWSKTFSLPRNIKATTATIVIAITALNYADITINGVTFAIPIVTVVGGGETQAGHLYRDTAITIPAGLFKFGKSNSNSISIQTVQDPLNGNYDDIEFNSVYVYFH